MKSLTTFDEGQLDHLFKNYLVTIIEKIEGLKLSFIKTKKGFTWLKRHNFLTKIDRACSTIYESAINYLENLECEIPLDVKFSFILYSKDAEILTPLDEIPKNNLILVGIDYLNEDQPVHFDFAKYAKRFGVSELPVIFHGQVSEEQKQKIYGLVSCLKNAKNVNINLNKYLYTILHNAGSNGEVTHSFNSKCFNLHVDTVFFKFTYGNMSSTYKISKDILRKKMPNDFYIFLVKDLVDKFKTIDLSNMPLESKDIEDKYIEMMCILFNLYIKDKKFSNTINNSYFKAHDINLNMIKNVKTLSYLTTLANKYILKILLQTFYKPISTKTEYLDDDLLESHRLIMNRIDSRLQDAETYKSLLTFQEYKATVI